MDRKRDRIAYRKQFNETNYDRIELTVPKGQKKMIQKAAREAGESINRFIQTSVLQRIGLVEWPTEG